jgi:hypothetical protein
MSIDIATLRPKLEAALGAQLQLGALLGQGGFAVVAAPDTLYQDLSGREAFLLMNEFVTLQRAQKARDSTSK